MDFKLHSKYKPTGDQPEAIDRIVEAFRDGEAAATLLGVTGYYEIGRASCRERV